jgi:hypothetical protein
MAMAEGLGPEGPEAARVAGAARRVYVRYSAEVAKRLCERVAGGELLYAVCRDADMPTPEGVSKWVAARPDFALALTEARRAGGRPVGSRGGVWTYCQATAEAVFERLCEGESLTAIGRDPTMPSLSTIFYWRRRIPEFEDAVRLGKEIQAERFCDRGCELADAATPETAYLTHVRLTHLRWVAGVMAPKAYRIKTVEPATPPRTELVLMRRFEIEVDAQTGARKVVAYCPNPETGQVECEDVAGWRPPSGPDVVRLPGGG